MEEDNRIIKKVTIFDTTGNLFLVVIKMTAGIISNSSALISDAVHSASDVLSALVMYVGVRISTKDPDKHYQYGYGKIENVTAIIMSMILFSAGVGIGTSGIEKIMEGSAGITKTPGMFALIVAIAAIVTKELMFWYIRSQAIKADSGAIMAEAWHQRSDGIASVGSLIGIAGARMGFPLLDPIASIVICLFIIKTAIDIFRNATSQITDKAVCEDTKNQILKLALVQEGVLGIQTIKTRLCAENIEVEIGVLTDSEMTVAEASVIKADVKYAILQDIPDVRSCIVQVFPAKKSVKRVKEAKKIKIKL